MSLARAAGTERDDILAPLDPFATRQFQHLHLVELRDGGKVEAVETFYDRELRRLDAAFDLAAVALDHLPFGKPGQIADMIDALGGPFTGKLMVLALEGRTLLGFEIVATRDLGGIGASAASSPSIVPRRRINDFP